MTENPDHHAHSDREKQPPLLEHGGWPERSGRGRVLIEDPDPASLWAQAEILEEAGYQVATCAGPTAEGEHVPWFRRRPDWDDPHAYEQPLATRCPLIALGSCPLVDGADVVVSSTRLGESREILTVLARGTSTLIVEGTTEQLKRDEDIAPSAIQVAEPVSPEGLLAAVEAALAARPTSPPA